jgi:hypothetical protein
MLRLLTALLVLVLTPGIVLAQEDTTPSLGDFLFDSAGHVIGEVIEGSYYWEGRSFVDVVVNLPSGETLRLRALNSKSNSGQATFGQFDIAVTPSAISLPQPAFVVYSNSACTGTPQILISGLPQTQELVLALSNRFRDGRPAIYRIDRIAGSPNIYFQNADRVYTSDAPYFDIVESVCQDASGPTFPGTRYEATEIFTFPELLPPYITSQEFQFAIAPDTDEDGEHDSTDACPDTPMGAEVDSAGCSIMEFCQGFSGHQGNGACLNADWRNNEPLGNAEDCRAVGMSAWFGSMFVCVPR